MSFDMSTAVAVDDKPTGTSHSGGFDIASARPVEAPGGKTDFESFQEDTRMLEDIGKATSPGKTPGLDEAISKGTFSDVKDPGFLNSAAITTAGALQDAFVKPVTGEGVVSDETVQSAREHHPVEAVLAGTVPFIASAPLFPEGLVGISANFAAVSASSEIGRQRTEESLMKPMANKALDVARETSKGALMGPIWHYSNGLQFVGRPFASALVRAGVRGAGTASLDKVYGSDLASAFKDGGTITALSLIFENPYLAKTPLGRGIIQHTNDKISTGLFGSDAATKVAQTSKPVKINADGTPEEIKRSVLDSVNTLSTQVKERKPQIIGAAVKVRGKVVYGASHEDALAKIGESKDTMAEGTRVNPKDIRALMETDKIGYATAKEKLESSSNTYEAMFRTSDGRLITRDQAKEEFGITDSHEVKGLNQQKFLAPPREVKIVNMETLKGQIKEKGQGRDVNDLLKDETGKMDINMVPGVAEASIFLETAHDEYVTTLKPMDASKAAKMTAIELRKNIGEMVRSHDRFEAAMKQASKVFEKASKQSIIDTYTKAERGEKQESQELQDIYDTLQKTMMDKAKEVQDLGTGKLEDLIENYLPHVWAKPGKAQAFFGKYFAKRPFEGGKAFLKKRIIGDFSQGIEAGLEPVSWNPVDLTMIKLREMDKYIMAHKTLNALKEQGLMKFVRIGGDIPEGFKKVNDSLSDVYSRGPEGELILRGRWYGQQDAVRIIDNYLSPGLQGKPLYNLYRGAGNTLNQFQLGMSAFHLGFTSMDATVSKFALGFNKLAVKDYAGAAKAFAASPAAPITNYLQGRQLLAGWRGESENPLTNKIADLMASAGGRAKMDKFYATGMREQMSKALKEGKVLSAAMKTPLWVVEQMSRPIMEHIVPAQKAGVFHDLMKFELEAHPDMTHEQAVEKAQKIWDSVDNRMGQLVYDNLFWNKTLKDLSMASVRSLGWNLGTIREIGGGLKDVPMSIKGVAQGSGMSYRTAYIMALPIVAGIYGAIYQYLATGEGPKEPRDLWFPRNGGIDKNGEPSRVSLPSYMKDIYHYTKAPIRTLENKLSPVNTVVLDMLNNRDFYGTKIINEDDSLYQKGLDELKFVGSQMVPFSISNMGKSTKTDVASKVQPFMGITPAPYDVSMTKAERSAYELSKGKIPLGARTKEQAEHSKTKADIRNKYFDNKDIGPVNDAVKDGTITPKEKKEIVKESKMTGLGRLTNHLSYEEVQSLYAKATPDERTEIDKILKKKKTNAQRAGTWSKARQALYAKHFAVPAGE